MTGDAAREIAESVDLRDDGSAVSTRASLARDIADALLAAEARGREAAAVLLDTEADKFADVGNRRLLRQYADRIRALAEKDRDDH